MAERPESGGVGTEAGREVLEFWFDELSPEQHFATDAAVDRAVAQRFGELHAALSRQVPEAWRADPRSMLAAIIVLDQFSRNLFRGQARAFAQDGAALALAKEALAKGFDRARPQAEKLFLYMPFMHFEDLAEVERCVALMRTAGIADGETFARRHAETIARFGRYPARNDALGRTTTAAEAAFLAANPAGF